MVGTKKNKLVHGWGINDVDYNVHKYEIMNGKKKRVWVCPYYRKWCNILQRCFYLKFQERSTTYKGCTVADEWQRLSAFIKWVDSQPNRDWENCQPDKDILFEGNKHYSPETVVFVSRQVNGFIADNGKIRGKYMVGVCYSPKQNNKNPYLAGCRNPFGGNPHLGYYQTEIEAHKTWQAKKHEYACQLADMQTDGRVAKILRERYAPDKDWTNR